MLLKRGIEFLKILINWEKHELNERFKNMSFQIL